MTTTGDAISKNLVHLQVHKRGMHMHKRVTALFLAADSEAEAEAEAEAVKY